MAMQVENFSIFQELGLRLITAMFLIDPFQEICMIVLYAFYTTIVCIGVEIAGAEIAVRHWKNPTQPLKLLVTPTQKL